MCTCLLVLHMCICIDTAMLLCSLKECLSVLHRSDPPGAQLFDNVGYSELYKLILSSSTLLAWAWYTGCRRVFRVSL